MADYANRAEATRALYDAFAAGDRAVTEERLIEEGDEVVVTYEATREDGSRFRNTEVLGFDGDQVVRTEVYFGWELE